MPFATGVFKKLSLKKQATLGVKAPAGAAGSARYMRRVSSTLKLGKAIYTSAEINTSQQRRDVRHGVRNVTGTISGELSVGGYQLPIESVVRRIATAGGATNALTNITTASAGAGTNQGTLTRAAGDFIADGHKVGDVIRLTGAGAGANTMNLLIVGLTATVMTVRTLNKTDITAQASGSALTIALAGKKTFIPQANHTRDYYTIEHFYSDIPDSEQFVDSVFTGVTIGLPATGMATVSFPIMGLNMETGNAEYFTNPAAPPNGGIVAANNGLLIVNGIVVATVTGLTVTLNGNYSVPGGVVGSNVDPDVFPGVIDVTGQMTVLFTSSAMRDLFLNETEFGIIVAMTENNTPLAGVIAISMPRCKLTDSDKDDSQTQLTQTFPFQSLENVAGGAGTNSEASSFVIQDTAFV